MSEKHPIIPGLSCTHPDDCDCLVCSETRAECTESPETPDPRDSDDWRFGVSDLDF